MSGEAGQPYLNHNVAEDSFSQSHQVLEADPLPQLKRLPQVDEIILSCCTH